MSDKPRRPWALIARNWRYVYVVVVLYALATLAQNLLTDTPVPWTVHLFDTLLFRLLAPLGLIWFVEIFSTPLPNESTLPPPAPAPAPPTPPNADAAAGGQSANKGNAQTDGPADPRADVQPATSMGEDQATFLPLKRKWMIFAYGFMFYAIAVAVYPFMVDRVPEPTDVRDHADYVERRVDAPISVLRGCLGDATRRDSALGCFDPDEPEAPPRLVWMIQVGGDVSPLPTTPAVTSWQVAADELTVATAKLTSTVATASAAGTEMTDATRNTLASAVGAVPDAAEAATQALTSLAAADSDRRERATEAREQLRVLSDRVTDLAKSAAETDGASGLVNEANALLEQLVVLQSALPAAGQSDTGFELRGGLVIPLYLVILSLIGGAVSLTRRVPELQKQSDPSYTPAPNAPRLSPGMLREYLVFQIVQFVSAPLVAAVAYYLIGPSTTSAAVVLAFAAGFASETVLLWVRAAVEKLEPAPTARLHAGSVVGRVTNADGKPVAGAAASIVGVPGVAAETDAQGAFVLDAVPTGDWAVEVTAADGSARCLTRVTVAAEKASFRHIRLPKSGD